MWILLTIIAGIAVGEGFTVVAFLFAAAAENADPTTVDLEDA